MRRVEVYSVLYSLLDTKRIVLLKESEGPRFLAIWIGHHESEAIALQLQGATVHRPLTHDLLNTVITELGGDVDYVVVTELTNDVFIANLAIQRNGVRQMLDSRPSDAIALALRAEAPIYCEDEVLDIAGILPSPDLRASSSDGLEAFRDLFESLDLDNLDDLGD